MIFKSKVRINRYYMFLWWWIGGAIIFPIFLKEGNMFDILVNQIHLIFARDPSTMRYLFVCTFPALFMQIYTNIITSKNITTLELKDSSILIKLYGILWSKDIEWKYSEIRSLEYSTDRFQHFVFTLKNGDKQMLRSMIYDKEKAFELIQQKIKSAN